MTGRTGAGRNARLALVRGILHDMQCTQGVSCPSQADHARRTQHDRARRIVDGGMPELLDVLHETLCHPHCESDHRPDPRHPKVVELAERMGLPDHV